MGMSIDEAKTLEHFLCSDCSSEDETKRPLNSFHVSPPDEAKVKTLYTHLVNFYMILLVISASIVSQVSQQTVVVCDRKGELFALCSHV